MRLYIFYLLYIIHNHVVKYQLCILRLHVANLNLDYVDNDADQYNWNKSGYSKNQWYDQTA